MPHTVVVQYVPDAVTGERINIGVVVVDGNRAKAAFLTNWSRVKQFAGKKVSFLKDLQRESRTWDGDTIRRLSTQWTGSIQFATPRFTVLAFDDALLDGLRRYLSERKAEGAQYRVKSDAVKIVKRRIRETLVEQLGALGGAMIKDDDYQLSGKHLRYEFDISVGNGSPLFAAQGVSFEVPLTRRLEQDIAATAWLIEDVRRASPNFPILVGVLPPIDDLNMPVYENARSLFEELGAGVADTEGVSAWAEQRVRELPAHFHPRVRP